MKRKDLTEQEMKVLEFMHVCKINPDDWGTIYDVLEWHWPKTALVWHEETKKRLDRISNEIAGKKSKQCANCKNDPQLKCSNCP